MKLETLKKYMAYRKRTKLHMISPEFLLTAYISNLRISGNKIMVDAGPYAVYSISRDEIKSGDFHCLVISDDIIFTRRYQTHLKHMYNISKTPELEKYIEIAEIL